MRTGVFLKAILCVVFCLVSVFARADQIRGRVLLDDGDTVLFRVRLFGVDTPEKRQHCRDAGGRCYPCGAAATRFVAGLLNYRVGSWRASKDELRCQLVPGRHTYGRQVGVCYRGGVNVNVEIVRAGWGVAARHYLDQVPGLKRSFLEAEAVARSSRRGIWQGEFVEPRDWRRGKRLGCG